MKSMFAAGFCAAALALAPLGASAEEAATPAQDVVEQQVRQIAALTEIAELAVVKLRRAEAEEAEAAAAEGDPAQMSEEDLLLGGVGTRQMLTADDEDDPFEAEAEADPEAELPPRTHGPDAEEEVSAEPGNGPLVEAIEANSVLSGALEERGVDFATVVGVEVRDGTSVIVYVDETRS